jgi:hypothetical protein
MHIEGSVTLCENHMQTTTEDEMRWLGVCLGRPKCGICGRSEEVRSITRLGGISQAELAWKGLASD